MRLLAVAFAFSLLACTGGSKEPANSQGADSTRSPVPPPLPATLVTKEYPGGGSFTLTPDGHALLGRAIAAAQSGKVLQGRLQAALARIELLGPQVKRALARGDQPTLLRLCEQCIPASAEVLESMRSIIGAIDRAKADARSLAKMPEKDAPRAAELFSVLNTENAKLALPKMERGASDITQGCDGMRKAVRDMPIDISTPTLAESAIFNRAASGTITNKSNKAIALIHLQFNLFDSSGVQVGNTTATIQNLSPGVVAKYEAPVIYDTATEARLGGVLSF